MTINGICKKVKPVIKWVGGKRRFLNEINNEVVNIDNFNNYFEPFAGSAAVMFFFEPKNEIYINDLNESLINFYIAIKKDWKKVIFKTRNLILNKYEPQDYYEIRKKYNEMILNRSEKVNFNEASIFLYLNKVGFNGMYRVNSKGEFNIPKGKYKKPYIPTDEEMEKASRLLNKAKIHCGEWYESIKNAGKGDLIYLDPPYFPDESSKFLGYTNPKFDEKNHYQMVQISKEKVDLGATVLISNSASNKFEEIVKEIFGSDKYIRKNIKTKRSINPNVIDKNKFIETLYILRSKNE